MPLWLKFILGIAALWICVYSSSYAVFELKQKKLKSGIITFVTVAAMLSAFVLFIF